jgi:hypothetical protein
VVGRSGQAADTSLLDQLPLAGDVLPRLSPRLKARLFQVFDISVLWNKPGRQVTVTAEITDRLQDRQRDAAHAQRPCSRRSARSFSKSTARVAGAGMRPSRRPRSATAARTAGSASTRTPNASDAGLMS